MTLKSFQQKNAFYSLEAFFLYQYLYHWTFSFTTVLCLSLSSILTLVQTMAWSDSEMQIYAEH